MEYPTCHLYFLGIHTGVKARLYTEEIQEARKILYGIPLESVASHNDIVSLLTATFTL